jgi:hypothetical protein
VEQERSNVRIEKGASIPVTPEATQARHWKKRPIGVGVHTGRQLPRIPGEESVRQAEVSNCRSIWKDAVLRRSVRRLVRERLAEPDLLRRSSAKTGNDRRMAVVAGIAMANPDMSLRDVAAQLGRMRERTPRGAEQWTASSVKNLLDRARKQGSRPALRAAGAHS